MTAEEEKAYWQGLVNDLCGSYTIKYLAAEFGVTERQVSNWKNGDRPMGFKAIAVYLFHVKHRTPVHEK